MYNSTNLLSLTSLKSSVKGIEIIDLTSELVGANTIFSAERDRKTMSYHYMGDSWRRSLHFICGH